MAKKNFKDKIPTMSFISQESIDAVEQAPVDRIIDELEITPARQRKAPAGYKPNPEFIETKSRRVQALVHPSVYEAVKAKAQAEGISTNEAINNALRKYIEE